MKIVALICCYREEKTIRRVVRQTLKYVDKLIVVDDGSTDKTPFILSHMKDGKLDVVYELQNMGKGYALRQGFKEFLKGSGDIVVTLDADLQHNPKEIDNLTGLIKQGTADVVIGSRYMKTLHSSRLKVFLNILANINLLLASGAFFSDVSSGYRAYSRKSVKKILPRLSLNGFGIELDILKACVEEELSVGVVPVSCDYRVGKKTNLSRLFEGHWQFTMKYKNDMIKKILGLR